MILNKEALTNAFVALKTIFNNALKAQPGEWQRTAMLVPSTTKSNDYSWLANFPRMKRWIGEKAIKALAAFKYTIQNDDWEATVEVKRNDIEDDNLGIYRPQAEMAGDSARLLPDEIVDELKNGAFANNCYDGQYYYDTDHPVGDGTVSNKGTAALSNATLAVAQTSYGAARAAIMQFKDDEGRPLKLRPDTLEVPPALEEVGRMLLESDKLADGTPNPYKGTATLLVNEGLTSTTAWFLHVTTKPIKPFIYQLRKAPVFVSQTAMDADDVFNRAVYKFGAEARAAGGYGFWQLSYGSTGAG